MASTQFSNNKAHNNKYSKL